MGKGVPVPGLPTLDPSAKVGAPILTVLVTLKVRGPKSGCGKVEMLKGFCIYGVGDSQPCIAPTLDSPMLKDVVPLKLGGGPKNVAVAAAMLKC